MCNDRSFVTTDILIFNKNHFRPDGQKYKKAREWQTGVVNAQWLTDLLCGQMNALHQTENPKYQQYSLGNPFRLDYSLVPHLMGIVNLINCIFFQQENHNLFIPLVFLNLIFWLMLKYHFFQLHGRCQ